MKPEELVSIDQQFLLLRLGGMPMTMAGGFTTSRWTAGKGAGHQAKRTKESRKDDTSIGETVEKFLFG